MKNLNKGTYHELSRQASIMSYKREIENFTMRGEDNEITEARYYSLPLKMEKDQRVKECKKCCS